MASAEEYAGWIVANQDKKGTPEFETVANAYRIARGPAAQSEKPMATGAEVAAGLAPTRFALAAASPFFTAGQLADEARKRLGLPDWMRPELASIKERIDPMVAAGRKEIGSEGFDPAEMAGAAMSPLSLAAMKLAPAASYLGKVAQGTGIGAGFGALSPATQDENFLETKAKQTGAGAGFGLFLSAIAPLVQKGGAAAYHALIEPWANPAAIKGRAFLEAAGDKADEIIALLKQNREFVPGSAPTAGEAAAPAGRAEFASLQKSAEKAAPSPYVGRVDAQNAARIAALRTVGKDETALTAAEANRAANAAENYGRVRADRINPQSEQQIMEEAIAGRQASKGEALRDWGRFATTEAQNEVRAGNFVPVPGLPRVSGRASNFPERAAEAKGAAADSQIIANYRQNEAEYLRNATSLLKETVGLDDKPLAFFLNRPSMRAAVKDAMESSLETGSYFPTHQGEKFSVQNLQRMKESLDAGIRAAKNAETAGKRPELSTAELEGTRREFIRWLSSRSTGWKEARLQYAADSLPINQMKVGQYLEKKLVPAISDEAKQRAAVFANAVEEAPRTLKNSIGKPLYTKLEQALTPDQMAVIEGLQSDLARGVRFEELAKRGSQAGPNAMDLATQSVEKAAGGKIPGMLERGVLVFNSLLGRLEGRINAKLAAEVAAEMLNPPGVAKAMESATARANKIKMLAAAIERTKLGAAVVAGQQGAKAGE